MTLANEVNVFRQNADDIAPMHLEITSADCQPSDVPSSGQHTWNRLIADFVSAVRADDLSHESVPHLAHVADGLASHEAIVACERSHSECGWVGCLS